MDDFVLDEMEYQALNQLKLIGEIRKLREENVYLKRQVKRYDEHMTKSLEGHNKTIGMVLTSLIDDVNSLK